MLRTVAEFSCDMPYDAVEDGGDFIEAPGRTVAEALAEIAAGRGCAATQVASVGDHGWLFHLRFRSAEVACEVTAIDGLVAQFFGPEGDRGAASPTHADFVEALTMIGEAIAADRRFRDFGWFTPEEATSEQVGAATPTGAYDAAPCFRTFGPPRRGSCKQTSFRRRLRASSASGAGQTTRRPPSADRSRGCLISTS